MIHSFNLVYAVPIMNNICDPKPIVFAFFNGVQTTPEEARHALEKMKSLYGEYVYPDTAQKIQYEVMYNYTKGFEDFVETFQQRFQEQGVINQAERKVRYELFFQVLKGGGNWLDKLKTVSFVYQESIGIWIKLITVSAQKTLSDLSKPNIITSQNYAEHTSRIDNWIIEGKKMLFVAHSQGNLFANAAYDYARKKVGAESVKVVHIAPASLILNGPHTLVSEDVVIVGLTIAGGRPSITTYVPGVALRPAGLNGSIDLLGHGLLEIYLNPKLNAASRIEKHIKQALKTLVAPEPKAKNGLFTVSLYWDGEGDVDLHIKEARGRHVYFRSKEGDAGYLDIDNVEGYGPEHYYTSCEHYKMFPGMYKISLANYLGAQGRKATVQVSSVFDGVLGTKTVTMGAETADEPSINVFNVLVDSIKGQDKYSVSLQP